MTGVEFIVYGTPAPQGSKRHVGHGRMVEQSTLVRPWREAVKWAWLDSCRDVRDGIPGPVSVEVVFYFAKPAKPKHRFPVVKDIDKLLRSTFDALTQSGAIEDDRFIVTVSAGKAYAGSLPYGLQQPGATIKIRRAG